MKTYCINFTAKIKCDRDIGYLGAIISCANYTKFLGLTVQNDITWDGHIEDVIKKLNTACYVIRNLKPVVTMETLRNVFLIFPFRHDIWYNILGQLILC
jgi:hypothetical protein